MVIGGAMTSSVAIWMGLSIFFKHCDVIAIAVAMLHAVAGKFNYYCNHIVCSL